MTDTTARAPHFIEKQNLEKARAILNGVSHYRVDPSRIKMTDAAPRHHGGQGVITVGTLSLPRAVKKIVFDFKAAAETVKLSPEEHIVAFHKARGEFDYWPPELTVDAALEMFGMSPKELMECLPESRVAVKLLGWNRDDAEESTKFFKSFAHELSLMAELSHPNVVRLVGFVEDMEKGKAWMILPWESNGNVREFLQSGEWDIPERISLIQDTARGLEYLHSRQPPICHGDLKSLNILVNSGYCAVITDFGSARIKRNVASGERENPLVNDGRAAGLTSPEVKLNPSTRELTLTGPMFSLRWTAPEVLGGEDQDLSSDMWAIGWICWEIVTGKIPFEELNKETAIVMRAINGTLPAIRDHGDLSHVLKLCSLMSECWALEPANRIDASSFQRRVRVMPSVIPSGYTPGCQKTRSALLLIEMGQMYQGQESFAKAMDCFQSALDVATQTRDETMKGRALNRLAQLYFIQGREGEAEQTLIEAHDVHSRIGDDSGVAHDLGLLGQVYRIQSKYREAEKAAMEAYEMFSRLGDIPSAGEILVSLGHLYSARFMHQDAEKALIKAYEMLSGVGDDRGAADALLGLGDNYLLQSNHSEAEKMLMKAYEVHSRIGHRLGALNTLNSLGKTYLAQSRVQEAEKAFSDASNILPLVGDPLNNGHTLRSLGILHESQCRYDEAEVSYRQALAAYDHVGHADGKSRTFLALGRLYHAQGRYLDAEDAVSEALGIFIRLGNEEGQASSYCVLADIFESQSKHDEGMAALIQAEAALAQTNHDGAHAETLDRLGRMQMEQGMYAEAEESYRHAQAILSRMEDARGEARALNVLGAFYLSRGRHGEAEESYRHAQAIFSSMEDAHGEARALNVLGAFYLSLGRHGEAEECFAQARVAFAIVADEDGEAKASEGLMLVYFKQRKFGDAKVACMEAREIYAQRGQPMSKICADVWEQLQHLEEYLLGSLLARFSES